MKSELKSKIKENEFLFNFFYSIKYSFFNRLISDEMFIKRLFRKRMHRNVDLEKPTTYNEKLQWLKLNWYDPIAVKCADKYEVRDFVENRIGENYLNELYAVYDSVEEIDLNVLPNSFVLKGTHGSGFNFICHDKSQVNWKIEFKKMKRWLKINYYWQNREWVYKEIKPRIICEKMLSDGEGKLPKDYKFFCFNGEPQFMFIASDRGLGTKFDFYDLEWNKIPVSQYYPTSDYTINKPNNLEEILELSRKLSKGFPHVRVDFYLNGQDIIFGELTFFHFSGTKKFMPEKYDEIIGNYLDLSKVDNKKYNA